MKCWSAFFSYFLCFMVYAGNPLCTVQVSAGEYTAELQQTHFVPSTGPTRGSGVSFRIAGFNVGAVAWGESHTKVLIIPSCFALTSAQVLYARAQYVGQVGGEQLKEYCYNEQLTSLSASEVVLPTFPGPLWRPCVQRLLMKRTPMIYERS